MQSGSASSQSKPVDIWAQMSYVPPRGPCAQRLSYISTCACFRFMVHPLKAATTFDCDGCGHHASFHKMDNEQEDEVMKRWERTSMAVDASHDTATTDLQQVGLKRRRIMKQVQAGRSVPKPQDRSRNSMREDIHEIVE